MSLFVFKVSNDCVLFVAHVVTRSRKSKKKEQGDGMLSMRARPPTEPEYIDIFQKFKLSFNLLVNKNAFRFAIR